MTSADQVWWAAWSDYTSEFDAGTRHRRRISLSGKCRGSSLQNASCQRIGFWLWHNRLLYASAATLALLALIAGAMLLLLKHNRGQQAGYTRLPPYQQQRTRQTRPPARRRPPPKPTARIPPTRQWNPNANRKGQISKPELNRPPQKRSGDMGRTGNTSRTGNITVSSS